MRAAIGILLLFSLLLLSGCTEERKYPSIPKCTSFAPRHFTVDFDEPERAIRAKYELEGKGWNNVTYTAGDSSYQHIVDATCIQGKSEESIVQVQNETPGTSAILVVGVLIGGAISIKRKMK